MEVIFIIQYCIPPPSLPPKEDRQNQDRLNRAK
jgi:hypothetical protein